MKINKLLIVFFLFYYVTTNAQTNEISEEESLLFFLKINNVDPDEITYKKGVIDNKYTQKPETWTKSYLERLDTYNYKLAKNDEFKCYELFKTTRKKLISKSQNIDFNKKYNIIYQAEFGEYDFNQQAFPIIFYSEKKILFNKPEIYLCELINKNDFEKSLTSTFSLKISPPEASKFISNRKNLNTGYIDRKIYLKITYSILNQVNYKCPKYFMVDYFTGLIGNAYSIEVWTDENCFDKKLGEVKKIKDTQPIITQSDISTYTSNLPNCGKVTDIDGNLYNTVTIGNQCWMTENLKTSNYNDGTPIYNAITNTEWSNLTTGGYCYFNNNASHNTKYGKLYNWYAVNSGKLCPLGWQVPTDEEWKMLITFLGGTEFAGGKMKAKILWEYPNEGATNSSGFNAIPTGGRSSNGKFTSGVNYPLGYGSSFFTSTEYNDLTAKIIRLHHSSEYVFKEQISKKEGLCARCIKSNNNNSISPLKEVGIPFGEKMSKEEMVLRTWKSNEISPLNDEFIKTWLTTFDGDNYSTYYNNEFKLSDKIQKTNKYISEKLDNLDNEKLFYIDETAYFDEYDFNNEVFKFNPFPKQQFTNTSQGKEHEFNDKYVKFFSTLLLIDNLNFVNNMPMNKSNAEKFLESRTTKNVWVSKPDINRKIYLRIYYSQNIADTYKEEYYKLGEYQSKKYKGIMGVPVVVQAFEDSKMTTLLCQWKNPNANNNQYSKIDFSNIKRSNYYSENTNINIASTNTNENSLIGTWVGTYKCPQGVSGLKLTFTTETDVIFEFYPIPENPNIPSGSIKMKAEKYYNNQYNFKYISWIDRPSGYGMVDFIAKVNFGDNTIKGTLCDNLLIVKKQ